jgi:hypothetical protein
MTPMLVVMPAIGSTDVLFALVPEICIPFSLGFIVLVLAVTTLTSLQAANRQEAAGEAAAEPESGALRDGSTA